MKINKKAIEIATLNIELIYNLLELIILFLNQ